MRMGRFFCGGRDYRAHFTTAAGEGRMESVTIYDNLSSGRDWHFGETFGRFEIQVCKWTVKDVEALKRHGRQLGA